MKRILIVFALAVCLLSANAAQADSFSSSSNLLQQVQSLTGKNAMDWSGYLPTFTEDFDIAVFFAAQDADPFAGNGATLSSGFSVLENVRPQSFFNNVTEVVSSEGAGVVYEYNGGSVELPGGTIFVSADINGVGYVFALAPSSANAFGAVPVPAAVLLLGTGVAGIVAMRRKMS